MFSCTMRVHTYTFIYIYPEPLKHYIKHYTLPIKTHQRKTTKPHHHHHQLTLTCILSELKKVLSILFRVLPNKCKSISQVPKRHKIVYVCVYIINMFFFDPKKSADCCMDLILGV